jgi:hypothetical protein
MGVTCSTYGEEKMFKIAIGKSVVNLLILLLLLCGNRPLGRPRRRWEGNMRMDFGGGGRVWTGCIWLSIGTSGGLL